MWCACAATGGVLLPVRKPAIPQSPAADGAANPIDCFVLAKLSSAGLHPAPPADRKTLARRLSFVLTGLPPRADDLRRFEDAADPHAYEGFADSLLCSGHFGENWARHWMDVVRYGDTYGYEWDIPARGAWRYRDYLIRAFNADVPYDQFVREQIAGDLLDPPRINSSDGINESKIGTMFLQLGENRHGDSGTFNGVHQEMLNNKIDAFSRAFQATTVACAKCHDHKLDAVSQARLLCPGRRVHERTMGHQHARYAAAQSPDHRPFAGIEIATADRARAMVEVAGDGTSLATVA